MKIPRYWAREGTEVRRPDGGTFDLALWRWSDASEAEARSAARDAVAGLAQRFARGEQLSHQYEYGLDRPLREEIVREVSGPGGEATAVITRNAYGALVLNTARVMFVDVDFEEVQDRPAPRSGGLLSSLLGFFLGTNADTLPTGSPAPGATPEAAALTRVEQWVAANGGWGMRVYRTAAGLRLLVTSDVHSPVAGATQSVMQALGCDPLYVRLCKAQESFRARLTPKPWRCGLLDPHFSHPHADASYREPWLRQYDTRTQNLATCEFVKAVGITRVHPEAEVIVRMHDEATRAGSGLKLA